MQKVETHSPDVRNGLVGKTRMPSKKVPDNSLRSLSSLKIVRNDSYASVCR